MKKIKMRTLPGCEVVATAHTDHGLHEAALLRRHDGIGLVEVRLDCLADHAAELPRAVSRIKLPVLLTARHPSEGGTKGLSAAQRMALLEPQLPRAAFVDVELRNAISLAGTIALARGYGVGIILSFHDFVRTPPLGQLRAKYQRARRLGADLVKMAVTLRSPRDLAALLLLQASAKGDLVLMGMGPLGKVSRLVLPAVGTRLVYGFLDRPQVVGQWSAQVLAARLAEVAG